MPKNEWAIKRLGKKLRTLRIHRGLTLKALAHKLGYAAHGYLSEIESGKKTPTVELTLKIATFFDITTDQLLRDEIELDIGDAHKITSA